MKNKCCTIFSEQWELLFTLSNEEIGQILRIAIPITRGDFNHLEKQDGNHLDNHLDYQDVIKFFLDSTSTYSSNSTSTSLSSVSRAILSILVKSIRWREFDSNWGGKREGSGKKKEKIRTGIKCNYPGKDCKNENKDCANCKENEFSQTKSYNPYPPF